ncbi:MAG: hypothetical protein GF350_09860 [Chitinivibrionales bacterium]|nr:hypothetical protein [Chitinivibrionales bacterium]
MPPCRQQRKISPTAFPNSAWFTTESGKARSPLSCSISLPAWRRYKDENRIIAALKKCIADNVAEIIVLSLGAGGALVANGTSITRLHTPTVEIRSVIGAGDSMVGGITYALAAGNSINDSIRMGLAAGAAAVMTPGTQLCRAGDVFELYAKIMDDTQE